MKSEENLKLKSEQEYYLSIFKKFRSKDEEATGIDLLFDKRLLRAGKSYQNLAELYAMVTSRSTIFNNRLNPTFKMNDLIYTQAMSSRPDHGMKLRYYSELVSESILSLIHDLIKDPMKFFGGNNELT